MILLIKGLLSYILQFTVKFFLQQTQIYLFVSFCLDVQYYPMNKSSIHGLVVNPGDSKQRGLGLKLPTEQTIFIHHSFGSTHGAKEVIGMFQPTWESGL
jgi:hypothetical protein